MTVDQSAVKPGTLVSFNNAEPCYGSNGDMGFGRIAGGEIVVALTAGFPVTKLSVFGRPMSMSKHVDIDQIYVLAPRRIGWIHLYARSHARHGADRRVIW